VTAVRADVEAVIAKALTQLGVAESPANSNRTPYTRWYGLTGPWCAMFVSWSFWHAGYPLPPIRSKKGFAYCPDIVNWAKANGQWKTSHPSRGDIVLYDFGKGRASHTGIVLGTLTDGRIHTVEGNTNGAGSRDGGSVMAHYRSTGSVVGYVRVTASTPVAKPPSAAGRFVQSMLNVVRAHAHDTLIVVDGNLGSNQSKAAITEFQRDFNKAFHPIPPLVVDGVAGPATCKAIGWCVNMIGVAK